MNLTPDKPNKNDESKPFWDNTNLIAKILYRWKSHGGLFVKAVGNGASIKRMLISRFPYKFKDSKHPPSMHIEFTDSCNLKCVYCNNPHFAHPRQVMAETTFEAIIESLKKSKVDRICMGGGEATLHPKFIQFAKELKKVTKVLTVVTNGHWKNHEIIQGLVDYVDFVEISVEAGSKEYFEKTRIGADYNLVLNNLETLKKLRDTSNSKTRINFRLMIRPSQKGEIEAKSKAFWKPYADSIMSQYVLKIEGVDVTEDIFIPEQMEANTYPKCSLPFRNIQIRANGDIPICQISGSALNKSKRVIAGNIKDNSVNEIWNTGTFQTFRDAHRNRTLEDISICKGCKGC